MSVLTDGMSALSVYDDRLTDCACWRVRFDGYSFAPTIVVPFDTGLEAVEALARRKLFEYVTRHSLTEQKVAEYAADVARRRVLSVERNLDVTLDPRLG